MSNSVVTDWPAGSANTGWPQEPTGMLMPGRVQGWPAGTQRAANATQRLLAQAVAWWDVEQYRDGDRFLRNRGTGGELLDLRLGSSIAPNSNDPLYLPSADDGYVYLSGVAGNSLSVTAPATATQYIAYPLDRSASTATGAVVGGATFTFSTTGSWRLIELLDASNVVVDTIDCDVITSGSATSFTSGIVNQTVTINRSTSGRKSVCVPSRHKGGKPVMLLGTDDYLEVQDNWQRGLLTPDTKQGFTVVAVVRVWGTPTSNQVYISYGDPAVLGYADAAWALHNSTTNANVRLFVSETVFSTKRTGTISAGASQGYSLGATSVFAGVVDRGQLLTYVGATSSQVAARFGDISVDASRKLQVGRNVDALGITTAYANVEFYGAAVFRRALSPAEITTLSNYFTGRIA